MPDSPTTTQVPGAPTCKRCKDRRRVVRPGIDQGDPNVKLSARWDDDAYTMSCPDCTKQPDTPELEGERRLGYELAQKAMREARRARATLSLGRGPVEGVVVSVAPRHCEIETKFGRVFLAWAELDGFEILPSDQPDPKQVEEEGDWPELWIQRGDPLNPETWAIWGSAENDAVPYETDGYRRYVPADSSPRDEELTMIALALKNHGVEDVSPERGVEILIERLYAQRADSSPTEKGGEG